MGKNAFELFRDNFPGFLDKRPGLLLAVLCRSSLQNLWSVQPGLLLLERSAVGPGVASQTHELDQKREREMLELLMFNKEW